MGNPRPRILIVDDEKLVRELLHRILEGAGFNPIMAQDGIAALKMIRGGLPDLIVSDVKMANMDGLELLRTVKQEYPNLPVILVTGWGGVDGAVQAVKEGAYDYLCKPIESEKLLFTIRKALDEFPRNFEHSPGAPSNLPTIEKLRHLMGPSAAVKTIAEDVALVAPSDFSVVIFGEAGTGKELIARAIHEASNRGKSRMVPVDCGAIPESLFESELFGHEKGSFTGAVGLKPGKFEMAQGGTLFLDEITNLPISSQTKLLRAIQEKNFFRVGAVEPTEVDLRFIVATNINLLEAVRARLFSADLFYRLSEFTIKIPPLRERLEDILFLAERFVQNTNEDLGKQIRGLSSAANDLLTNHFWPGNVRQLKSTIRRAVLRAEKIIEPNHLDLDGPDLMSSAGGEESLHLAWTEGFSLKEVVTLNIREVERRAILDALAQAEGNKAQAARLLKIDYTTLHAKMKQFQINR